MKSWHFDRKSLSHDESYDELKLPRLLATDDDAGAEFFFPRSSNSFSSLFPAHFRFIFFLFFYFSLRCCVRVFFSAPFFIHFSFFLYGTSSRRRRRRQSNTTYRGRYSGSGIRLSINNPRLIETISFVV